MSRQPPESDPDCPFCTISVKNPVPPKPELITPTTNTNNNHSSSSSSSLLLPPQPQTHLLLATPTVLAFLDIMPITRGHILLVPRAHYKTLSDVPGGVAAVLGMWVPVVARGVCRALGIVVGGEGEGEEVGGYNVVQNNGKSAAQIVPHVHYHIIPRPSLQQLQQLESHRTSLQRSSLLLGRGQREDLDDADAAVLAKQIRREVLMEVMAGLGKQVVEKEDKEKGEEGWDSAVCVLKEEERGLLGLAML